jgi:uncharacterized membrane protein
MANRKWWQILGGIWFVLYGLLAVSNLSIEGVGVVMGFGAIIVGGLILLDR